MKILLSLVAAMLLMGAPAALAEEAEATAAEPAAEEAAAIVQQRAARLMAEADKLLGEELTYHINFWVFQDMAVGTLSLVKDADGTYVAKLDARTVGFVDKVLQHRHDIYKTRFALAPDGTGFVTGSFKKTLDINGRIRYGATYVDYEDRVVTWTSWGGGKEDRYGGSGFPEGVYPVDPLTAFYNFRLGVYGPVGEGNEYRIPTFPKDDKVPEMLLKITDKEEMARRLKGKKHPPADYLADARVDKEFFGSGKGEIEILLTEGLLPVRAVAKDVAFFGDVTGTLKEIGVNVDFRKEAATEPAE